VSTECFSFILIIEFQPLFLSKKVLNISKNNPYILRILKEKKESPYFSQNLA
jgi:hypothetical protein